ncbi:MAG TPA: LysR family transcriptional regulator, partial [Spongiibacteraceae bacterium]|nr:LysR family transcriptional regulator [Spongiibacteraceae bacterium]
ADQGSLTRAAAAMGLAQSALSRHISHLEHVLGGRLFHRTGRGVELTELGSTLLPQARVLLQEARQLMDVAKEVRRTPAGVVNIAVLPSMCRPLVGTLLGRLQEEFPDIRLRAIEAYSGEVQALLAEGKVDIGIFNRYRPTVRESQEAIFSSAMCLVGKTGALVLKQKSVRFATVSSLGLALPARPNGMRSLFDEIAGRQRLRMNVVLEANSGAVIKDALASCQLFSVLPPHAVQDELASGVLSAVPITHPVVRQVTFVETTSRHPMTSASREVLRLVRLLVGELDGISSRPRRAAVIRPQAAHIRSNQATA